MTLRVRGGPCDWLVMTGTKDSGLLLRQRGERKSRGSREREIEAESMAESRKVR